jgi:hypothetical protein
MAKMAFEMPVKALTINPAVDFSEKRYRFVTLDSNGNGIIAPAGKAAIGVIQEPNNVNQPANVMFQGISFIVFDGTVASGAEVEVGTDGKAKTRSTGTLAGIAIVGGADGDIGCVLIK